MRQAILVVTLALLPAAAFAQQPPTPTGADLYTRNCASCHDSGANRAPNRDAFRAMPAERILAAMETGPMVTMANNRTADERRAIAELLSGKALSTPVGRTPEPR